MSKKILITGGAGFIGSNLALKLIAQGYHVRVLDNLSEQIHEKPEESFLYNSIKNKVDFILGDVTNPKDWETALKEQEIVVHLAAETGTGQSMYEVSKYFNVNINGTAHLIDLLTNSKHSVQKLIVASSRAIYGEGKYYCQEHGNVYPEIRKDENMQKVDFECKCPICNANVKLLPTDETSAIHPNSYYGLTKQMQEQMVLLAGKTLAIPAIALRYQNVYGPGQSLSNPYTGILAIFSTLIRNKQNINVFEDGKESRDFVYIDDVVNATILAIESKTINNEALNIGSGQATTVEFIAKKLEELNNSTIDINISGNYRLGDIRHNIADLTRANKTLNYSPSFSFEQGIELFNDWVNKQQIQKSNYEKSIKELKDKGLFK
ncbi:MAG: SDR family NAD(P)-dependent oxidoreductase [Bacteroidales bacterium]|jgi:dTDP-L-rhamnose 4-epimerase|nr:SDR family NAD(P)-dependent oxidoreductase [Bacteroidales bacterium]